MRILLSSVGRRGYLVKFFKETLNNSDQIWGADNSPYAPAFAYCDNSILLPKITDPDYAQQLLQYCKTNDINMVIPLIDPELEVLSAAAKQFTDAGIMAVISPLKTVEIAFDKYLTYKFAKDCGILAAETVITIEDAKQFLDQGKLSWPLVVKARKGSASMNITYCNDFQQLTSAFETCPFPMIQEFLDGTEYGYDIFCDANFKPISVYCKEKLKMRAGETDKAISTSDPKLIALGLKIAENLQIFGPLDADVIVTKEGPKLLELNPRFGGGYPCSHLSGANFPVKLIAILQNKPLTADIGSCPDGICMLKQDEIISFKKEKIDSIKTLKSSL